MRILFFVLLFSFTHLGFAQAYSFNLTGNFVAQAGQKATLNLWDVDHRKTVLVESIPIDASGKLNAKVNQEPGLYIFKIAGIGSVNLAIDNNQSIQITTTEKGLSAEGTKDLVLLQQYETFRKQSLSKWMDATRAALRDAKKIQNATEVTRLSLQEQKNYLAHKSELTQWVSTHMGTSIAVYATSLRWSVTDLPLLRAMYPEFEKVHPNLKITKAFAEKIARFENIELGKKALEISSSDTAGNLVKLSNYLGNYVLIDFWASWCGPCRIEHRALAQVYAEYHSKGFEIFGVSLDKKVHRWKNAMLDDHVTWVQVSDLKGYTGVTPYAYNINAIPANVLINPKGEIIAYNLFGSELRSKLETIYGK